MNGDNMNFISKDYELQPGEEVPKMDTVTVKSTVHYVPIEPLYIKSPPIKTKIGESSGQMLYSMDGNAWYYTPENAIDIYNKKQEILNRNKK